MSDGELILVVGALLAGGIAISLLADRIRLPGLVLVLGLGMLLGSDGLGWLNFGDYRLARSVGVVALALILFEGGLAAGLPEIRPVLVARPAATFLATTGFGFSVPERLVLGWAGLRGAVPVVLATFPVIAGVAHSGEFFNIVFFAVLLSATLQGATFEAFARRLGVTSETAALQTGPLGPAPRRGPVLRGATVFTSRPAEPGDGDPARPAEVNGIAVREQLRTRRDRPGALVALADGRFAYTGPLVAVGPRASSRRRRLHSAPDDEQAWWREIIGALALR